MSLVLDERPNDIAQELTGRDYISWSQITTYQACPLKWNFRYRAGLPEKTVSSSLVFGGAIHRAVELHFRERMAGNAAPDIDTLLAEYQDAWRERKLDAVKFGKREDVNTLSQLAERVLLAFQGSEFAQPIGRLVGVEEELRGPVADDCPNLLARVDLMIEDDDALSVIDLKTARSRWSQQQAEDSGEQLLLYSELAKELMPSKPLRLQFLVITKAKTPVVEAHTVALDSARIQRTKRRCRTHVAGNAIGSRLSGAVSDELRRLPFSGAMPGLEGVIDMQQQALKMIAGMTAIGLFVAVVDRNPLPLLMFAMVSYIIWHVAKGFDGD